MKTDYVYDEVGRIAAMTQAGPFEETTKLSFTYDEQSRLTRVTGEGEFQAETDDIVIPCDMEIVYDAAGNVAERRAGGQVCIYHWVRCDRTPRGTPEYVKQQELPGYVQAQQDALGSAPKYYTD